MEAKGGNRFRKGSVVNKVTENYADPERSFLRMRAVFKNK